MFYNSIKIPAIIKIGTNILNDLNEILLESHLFFPKKILITQIELHKLYENNLAACEFSKIIYVIGGNVEEYNYIKESCCGRNILLVAFGGGSVIDIVKYTANKIDVPYITIPSTLSNDGIYSSVARLIYNGKKTSYGVQPPMGIIVDFEIIKKSPSILLLAGVADLISNLSAIQDWLLAYNNIKEPINELAFMLAKQASIPILNSEENDIRSDKFLFELANGLIISGLSMIVSSDTRGTSGAEHLISHAIDEYFPEKSTIHGLQVGWAHLMIEKKYRNNASAFEKINSFFDKIGLLSLFSEMIPWSENDFEMLIPYAIKIRNRYTIFSQLLK
jgi:glycerol-1-phosphate dehydrogenase [NAD(P)+]